MLTGHRAEILRAIEFRCEALRQTEEPAATATVAIRALRVSDGSAAEASTLRAKAPESVDFTAVRAVRRRLFRSRGKGGAGWTKWKAIEHIAVV